MAKQLSSKTERFIDFIAKLEVKDLLLTEFRTSGWKNIAICQDHLKKKYLCNVCHVVQYGEKNLCSHMNGKKHKIQMNEVKQLYHPTLTPPKSGLSKQKNEKFNESKTLPKNSDIRGSNIKFPETPKAKSFEITENQNLQQNLKKDIKDQSGIRSALTLKTKATHPINTDTNLFTNETVTSKLNLESSEKTDHNKSKTEILNHTYDALTVSTDQFSSIVETVFTNEMESNIIVKNPFGAQHTRITNQETSSKISCVSISKLLATPEVIDLEDESNAKMLPNIGKNEKQKEFNNEQKKFNNGNDNLRRKSCTLNNKSINQNKERNVSKSQYKMVVKPIRDFSSNFQMANHANMSKGVTFDSYNNKKHIEGFLGVEYVIQILKHIGDKSPRFECSFCELELNSVEMQNHLLGYNHRLKFCEKHFPTAIRQFRQYMADLPECEVFKVMNPILHKLALAIEEHHGRELPYKCYERDFSTNRAYIFSKVYSTRHASEQHGPTFTHVVDANEVDILIKNRNTTGGFENNSFVSQNQCFLSQSYGQTTLPFVPNSQIYSGPPVDDETHRLMVENFLKNTERKNCISKRGRSHSNDRESQRKRSYSTSIHFERKSLSPLREGDIWQAYRHMVDQQVYDLDISFEQYKKDPEKHPQYSEEWQAFWKRRKDELIAAGIDHRNYNFQNEWSVFFKSRMEEFYSQDLEFIKLKCRDRLFLPMTNDDLFDSKYHVYLPETNEPTHLAEYDDIQNHKDERRHGFDKHDSSKTEVNLIHVLRILAALEEHLGSLGPKITQMLSMAIMLEKSGTDYAKSNIISQSNCAILETAKEKFKGLMYSGLLDLTKERAINKAIKEIDQFLNYSVKKLVHQNQKQFLDESKKNYLQIKLNPCAPEKQVQSNKMHLIAYIKRSSDEMLTNLTESEKNELASKLASSLIAQGKTDFEPNHLSQIIKVYSLIEKKKRDEEKHRNSQRHSMTSSPIVPDNIIFNGLSESSLQLLNRNEDIMTTPSFNRNQQGICISSGNLLDDERLRFNSPQNRIRNIEKSFHLTSGQNNCSFTNIRSYVNTSKNNCTTFNNVPVRSSLLQHQQVDAIRNDALSFDRTCIQTHNLSENRWINYNNGVNDDGITNRPDGYFNNFERGNFLDKDKDPFNWNSY